MVAVHGPRPRRRGGPGLLRHPAPPGMGSLRPRGGLLRPAGGVPLLPQALPRGPPRGRVRGKEGPPRRERPEGHRLRQLRHPWRMDRTAGILRPPQDLPRPGGQRGRPALPAPGNGPGHLRELQQRADHVPQEAAVRHRPDRQVLPQRDHPGQLHLPHPRVRADGNGILRRARHGRRVAQVLDEGAHVLVHRPGHPRGEPALLRAPAGEAQPLLQGHHRHRIPLRFPGLGVGRARRHRQPHRL